MCNVKLVDKEHSEELVNMFGLWKVEDEMSGTGGVVTFHTIWRKCFDKGNAT